MWRKGRDKSFAAPEIRRRKAQLCRDASPRSHRRGHTRPVISRRRRGDRCITFPDDFWPASWRRRSSLRRPAPVRLSPKHCVSRRPSPTATASRTSRRSRPVRRRLQPPRRRSRHGPFRTRRPRLPHVRLHRRSPRPRQHRVRRRLQPLRRRPRPAPRLLRFSSLVRPLPHPRPRAPSRVRRRPRQPIRRARAPRPAATGSSINRSVRRRLARPRLRSALRRLRAPFPRVPDARRATTAIAPHRLGKRRSRQRREPPRHRPLARALRRLRHRSPLFPARSRRARNRRRAPGRRLRHRPPANPRCVANGRTRHRRHRASRPTRVRRALRHSPVCRRVLRGPALSRPLNPALRFRRLQAKPRSPAPTRRTSPSERPALRPFRVCLMRRPASRRGRIPAASVRPALPRLARLPAPWAASC